MKMETIEVYVLCKKRSQSLAVEFLDRFLPVRKASSTHYPFPEHSDNPEYVYDDSEALFKALEEHTEASYSVYWDNEVDGDVKNAMIFFTEDGGMVAGLAVACEAAGHWLIEVSEVVGGVYGYVSFDSPPPETQEAFVFHCKNSDQVKLIEGELA